MNKLVLLVLLLTSHAFAATITVPAFEIDFFVEEGSYETEFTLTMACRYEKFVIGDSAQYKYKFEDVPLEFTKEKISNGLEKITLKNTRERKLEQGGMFKSGKECQTMQKFYLKSTKYSVGWAGQTDRPIKLGLFEYSRFAKDAVYDVEKLKDEIMNKELGFDYRKSTYQVWVRFAFDGVPTTDISGNMQTSVPADKETQMPYPLKIK